MKHLILQDDELSFMVYYQPKKKAQLYELIFRQEQDYWKNNKNYESGYALLLTIAKKLQENGFKCVEITQELKEAINVYDDLTEDSFMYHGVKIVQSQYGYSFWVGKTMNSCLTIEQAIKEIDNA